MGKQIKCLRFISRPWIFGPLIGVTLLIGGLVALISLSALHYDDWYNVLTCDIYDVTPVVSTSSRAGSVYWTFQYSYQAQNCDESKIYTITDSSYFDALDTHDRFSNKSTATCYAEKNTDQCDVYMNKPTSTGFFLGMLLGSLFLVFAVIGLPCYLCIAYEDFSIKERQAKRATTKK